MRLENTKDQIFATGVYQPDDMTATSLSILLPVVTIVTDVVFECRLVCMKQSNFPETFRRFINITLAGKDIEFPGTILIICSEHNFLYFSMDYKLKSEVILGRSFMIG